MLLVVLHELGHFLAAKAAGMRVERFFLFFPPKLVWPKRGETEYGIGAIPAGGFVKISGMNPEEELPPEAKGRGLLRPAGLEADRGDRRRARGQPTRRLRVPVRARLLDRGADEVPGRRRQRGDARGGAPEARRRGDRDRRRQPAKHRRRGARRGAGRPARHPWVPRRGERRLPVEDARDGGDRARWRAQDARTSRPTTTARSSATGSATSSSSPATSRSIPRPPKPPGEPPTSCGWSPRRRSRRSPRSSRPRSARSSARSPARRRRPETAFDFGTAEALQLIAVISLSLALINLFPFLPLDGGHIFWSLVEKVRGRRVPSR